MSEMFYEAIVAGDKEEVEFFISAAVNLNQHFENGMTPVNAALYHHHEDIAQLLIETGANIHRADSFRYDGCERRPVHYAAACECLDTLRLLIEKGSGVDEVDFGNSTPIHHAAVSGNLEIVKYLLNLGSDVNHTSKSGRSALWKAAWEGHREIVHLLYAVGANLNTRHQVGATVLFEVLKEDHLRDITKDLVYFGIDVNIRDVEGNTALHAAASLGKTWAVKLLISAGVRIHTRNDHGNTALHNSARHNRTAASIYLLNCASRYWDINAAGQSPLYMAMLHKHADMVRLLHAMGARLTEEEINMYTLYEARRYKAKCKFLKWTLRQLVQVLPLTYLCRDAIRSRFKLINIEAVSPLPLPVSLKHFLLLTDFVSTEEKDDIQYIIESS